MFRAASFSCLVLLAASLRTQVRPDEPVVACRACGSDGQVACARHGKSLALETAEHVAWCSDVVDCKQCSGALFADCKRCERPDVELALAERQRLAAEWLRERRAHVAEAKNHADFLYLSTTHFELVFSLRPTTIDRKRFDTHALMHLYGERLEALRVRFLQLLELPDADLPDRMRVYMFDDQRDHGLVGPHETGFGSATSTGLKQMGPEFVYSMCQDRRAMTDDESVHRNIVHHVSHLLLSQMRPMLWLGNKRHGWVDEGLAHWFEDQLDGKCANYCYEEILMMPGAGFKGGRWRVPVRQLVDAQKVVSFATLSGLNTDQLDFEQHAQAFAWIDFLITARGGPALRDFVRLLKNGNETRDALKEVYGWNPLQIDEQFTAWVKENYSLVQRR
jgi:hypothetical protein